MSFAGLLRQLRAEALLTQEELAEPARELFVAAALGRVPAADVLAARDSRAPTARRNGECPYRELLPFRESDAGVFYGRSGWPLNWPSNWLAGRPAPPPSTRWRSAPTGTRQWNQYIPHLRYQPSCGH